MRSMIITHNLKELPKATRTEHLYPADLKLIDEWKKHPDTKRGWIGCKRRSVAAGLREFKMLNDVGGFIMTYHEQTPNWKDDSLEIFYRQKTV